MYLSRATLHQCLSACTVALIPSLPHRQNGSTPPAIAAEASPPAVARATAQSRTADATPGAEGEAYPGETATPVGRDALSLADGGADEKTTSVNGDVQ